jgi:ubiquitin carboxyl-terminal hydrolase 14
MQQDAEECWSQLISTLKAKLQPHVEGKENVVAQFMQGEFTTTYVLFGSRRTREP